MKRFHDPIFWRVRPSGYGFGGRAIDRDGEGGLLVGVVTRWTKTKKNRGGARVESDIERGSIILFPRALSANRSSAESKRGTPIAEVGERRAPPRRTRTDGLSPAEGNGTRKPPPGDPALGRKGGKRG